MTQLGEKEKALDEAALNAPRPPLRKAKALNRKDRKGRPQRSRSLSCPIEFADGSDQSLETTFTPAACPNRRPFVYHQSFVWE